jgi:hypothetical protein
MADAPTICITIPSLDGRCWVFIDPAQPSLAFTREFASRQEAGEYASALSKTMAWPLEDAAALPLAAEPAFDAQQAHLNELLWLMTTIVHDDDLDWDAPAFWADAARQQAQVILDVGPALPHEDLAVMLATGAAMLRLATDNMGLSSVDDVLATIMILEDEA